VTKTAQQATADINGGCHTAITAGVTGNLPTGWVCCGLSAQTILGETPPAVAVFCSAYQLGIAGWSSDQFKGGAKLEVEAATIDYLKLADVLAEQLRGKIAVHLKMLARARRSEIVIELERRVLQTSLDYREAESTGDESRHGKLLAWAKAVDAYAMVHSETMD
jgi:hypothetical protein